MAEARELFANWPIRRIAGYTLLVIFIGLGFYAAYKMINVISIVLVAIMVRVAVKPVFERLRRIGLSPEASVVILYAVIVLFGVGVIVVTVPLITEQAGSITARLPSEYANIRESHRQSGNKTLADFGESLPEEIGGLLPENAKPASPAAPSATPATTPPAPPQTETSPDAFQIISENIIGLFMAAATIMLAFYLTLEADGATAALILKLPEKQRASARQLIAEVEQKISAYFGGTLVLCLSIGVMSTAAYLLLGVKYALVLGILAGIFEAVPMLGPTLGMIPAVVVALGTNPTQVPGVVIAGVLIQQLENNLLVPRIMDKSVGVNPIISVIAITAFGALFGLLGALIAIPLAAIIQIILDKFVIHPAISAAEERSKVSRTQVGVWRLKAKELAADVRKQSRASNEKTVKTQQEDETLRVEDLIEKVANEIDKSLARRETNVINRARQWLENRQTS